MYLALLAAIGAAAVVRIAVTFLAFLGINLPGLMGYSACPVPLICIFDDPVMAIIDLVMPAQYFGPRGDVGPNVGLQYVIWNGPLVVALLIAALAMRRLLAFRAARSLEAPQSFSGFPFGLAILGFAFVVYGYLGGSGVMYFRLSNPVSAGVICLFVAFLAAELASFVRVKAPRAGDGAPEETILPRRRPIWGVLSLLLPLISVLTLFLLVGTVGRGDGFAGLAAASFGVVGIAIGLGLGAVATIVAVLRKERWIALQVVAFAVNFGIGLPMIVHLLRP